MMKTGKLYFLRRADGLVKIGYTADLKVRIERLSRSHGPLEIIRVINGDQKREKRLHHEFARFHEFGEWFRDGDELRQQIGSLKSGKLTELAKSEAERQWLQGEAAMMTEALRIVRRLIESRRQRTGLKHRPAIESLADDYGISPWLMLHVHTGRATTISAYAMQVLRGILPIELLKHRDDLLAAIADVERGKSSAEVRFGFHPNHGRSPVGEGMARAAKSAPGQAKEETLK